MNFFFDCPLSIIRAVSFSMQTCTRGPLLLQNRLPFKEGPGVVSDESVVNHVCICWYTRVFITDSLTARTRKYQLFLICHFHLYIE